ncbi:MAG: hypothetical protein ACKOE5_07030 [Cytophagales bacterium]
MQKGFLSEKLTLNIPKKIFLLGALIGTTYSILFYFFLIGCRETWRFFSLLPYQESFVFLSDSEIVFFNFFSAFVSCLTGFGVANDFWWLNVRVPIRVRQSVIVDQKSLQLFFNHVFFKLATFFGIFCGSISLFEAFEFYPGYGFLFYMLMFVLFFHQWINARLFFRDRMLKYMLVVGLIELSLSLLLSFIPLRFNQRMNMVLLKQTPKYYCQYELPQSSIAYGVLRKSISFPLFIGFSKQQRDSTVLVAYSHKGINPMSIGNLSNWVSGNRASLDEMEYGQMATELSADKHVKMKDVRRVMFQLRKCDARMVYFMVNKLGVGLPFRLRPLCQEILKADTIYQIINIPCDTIKASQHENKVSIELTNNKVLYQNKPISGKLAYLMEADIQKFEGKLQLDVFMDDNSEYEAFVGLLENIQIAYHQVWQKNAKKIYGITLSPLDLAPNGYNLDLPQEVRSIRRQYPMNLFLWSDEEIEYFNLQPK